MSTRGLAVHVLLSVVALLFAWRMANREEKETGGPSSVTLLDVEEGAVSRAVMSWPKGTAIAERIDAAKGGGLVVQVDREIEAKKDKKADKKPKDDADAGPVDAPDAGVPEAPPAREQVAFPGGKAVESALKGLEPLKSKRTLGPADPERLRAMGLEKPERTLTVTSKKGTLILEIGEAAYGGQGRYARVQGDSTVHLIDPAIVNGLEGGADALMEKRVLPVDPEDVLSFEVRTPARSGAFVQLERAQAKTRRFVSREDPATASEEAQKLINTVRGMRVTKLADSKLAGASVASFKVETDKRGVLVVELLERTDGAGFLARYGAWIGEITETQQKELVEDVTALLGE